MDADNERWRERTCKLLTTRLSCDSSMGLEELNRIAVGIFNLNLFATWADLHFISKPHAYVFQVSNARRQILHLNNHAVPSACLLLTAIGRWPRSRSAGAAQDQLEVTN